VIGEMAAGILLGPSFLGRISPAMMNGLFPANSLGMLFTLSQLGLVLFMFLVGLEVQPETLRGSAKSVIVASQASILAPFLFGGALAWTLYPRLGNGVPKLPFVLFLGAAMGITAFPVLARILADRKLMQTRVGVFAISCAAFDDLTAWCLLAVITAWRALRRIRTSYCGASPRSSHTSSLWCLWFARYYAVCFPRARTQVSIDLVQR
jgi:Kef-type K+ transport system membrane component KefB